MKGPLQEVQGFGKKKTGYRDRWGMKGALVGPGSKGTTLLWERWLTGEARRNG